MSEAPKLIPGQPISDDDKAALAKQNAEETETAHRLAAEQRQRDADAGRSNVANDVATSIKEKLQREEFQQKPEEEAV
jgi:hypothetical protein